MCEACEGHDSTQIPIERVQERVIPARVKEKSEEKRNSAEYN